MVITVFVSGCSSQSGAFDTPEPPLAEGTAPTPAGTPAIDNDLLTATHTLSHALTSTLALTVTPELTATVSVSPAPTADPDILLPDLQTMPPTDVVIQIRSGSQKLLRFSNWIYNAGSGKLEVRGVHSRTAQTTTAYQRLYRKDGTLIETAAGVFIFHPTHTHWHTEDFALYEVWSVTPEGELDQVLTFTDKVSYCLRDDRRSRQPDAHPRQVYTRCNRELQGISAGWIDVYSYDTPGQIVDITNVDDGIYALRSTVDPSDIWQETDDANNAAFVYIAITGNRVRVLDEKIALEQLGDADLVK